MPRPGRICFFLPPRGGNNKTSISRLGREVKGKDAARPRSAAWCPGPASGATAKRSSAVSRVSLRLPLPRPRPRPEPPAPVPRRAGIRRKNRHGQASPFGPAQGRLGRGTQSETGAPAPAPPRRIRRFATYVAMRAPSSGSRLAPRYARFAGYSGRTVSYARFTGYSGRTVSYARFAGYSGRTVSYARFAGYSGRTVSYVR